MSSAPSIEPPRAEARVDLDAISANVARLDELAVDAAVMAVVKADAYGHGLIPSAKAAVRGGAQWLGTALPGEALALRDAGITVPILAWLLPRTQPSAWTACVNAGIDLSVGSSWSLDTASVAAREAGRAVQVHLKIDTGLGRGGSTREDWLDLVSAAAKAEADGLIDVVGVWSHSVFPDEPSHPTVRGQLEVFRGALADAEAAGLRPQLRHFTGSGGALIDPSTHFDLVRPGIAVYGLSPGPKIPDVQALGLTPAMTLKARLAGVKNVGVGQGVSYGHEYVTATATTLGLVPLGYADGIPRAATNRGPVLAAGEARTVAGRVCMDQFVLDLGSAAAEAGDEVVLFGPGSNGEPTADDWAAASDTINYEIVTRLGPRIERTYVGEDGLQ